jgi:hypothetical protein
LVVRRMVAFGEWSFGEWSPSGFGRSETGRSEIGRSENGRSEYGWCTFLSLSISMVQVHTNICLTHDRTEPWYR